MRQWRSAAAAADTCACRCLLELRERSIFEQLHDHFLRAFRELAECAVFQTFARLTIDRLLEYSLGNPPGQGIHDCATLDNKDKYMSTGFEFIPPELDANIVLCTGMREIIDGGDDVTGAAMLDTSFKDVLGRPSRSAPTRPWRTAQPSAWRA